MKRPEITIKKSFFYSAGDKFDWAKDGFDKRGVGVAKKYFSTEGVEEIFIGIDGKRYRLSCKQARDFVVRYQSIQKLGGTKLCIVSASLLEEIK